MKFALVLAAILSVAAASAAAQVTPPPAGLLPPPWDTSTTLRASAGWRQNVTLSSVRSFDRAFWRTELESLVLRPIGPDWRLIAYLNGDVLRYFSPPPGMSGEQQWIAELQARWQPKPWTRVAAKVVGYRMETFIDPAETEGAQLPATLVRLDGGYGQLSMWVRLPFGFSLEPSLQEKRIDYRRGYAGDYSESRPGVTLAWSRSERLVISVSGYEHRRHYSHLLAYRSGSHLYTDRRLGLRQQESELKVASTFERGGTWTVSAAAGLLQNRDLAVGVLDYDQRQARLEVEWERAAWRVTLSGDARHLNYRNQTVGYGRFLTTRIADVSEATARVERTLSPRWTLFAQDRWERTRSNINDAPPYRFSYRANTALAGVQYSF